jgi:hypothetical protein
MFHRLHQGRIRGNFIQTSQIACEDRYGVALTTWGVVTSDDIEARWNEVKDLLKVTGRSNGSPINNPDVNLERAEQVLP